MGQLLRNKIMSGCLDKLESEMCSLFAELSEATLLKLLLITFEFAGVKGLLMFEHMVHDTG